MDDPLRRAIALLAGPGQVVEVRAIADYYEALTNLESVRGTVLEANNIEM